MSTRKTQNQIIDKALEMFNEHGSKAVSTNRIAEECGVSRGNLHYHFRTKEEIIQSIFQRIDREMRAHWQDDHLHPSMAYMSTMFSRSIRLTWDYRFFYLELTSLLRNDARLKLLFLDNRKMREEEVNRFFNEMINAGYFTLPAESPELEAVLLVTWLITEGWPPYLEMNDIELNEESITRGFDLILLTLTPYFTEKANEEHAAHLQPAAVQG